VDRACQRAGRGGTCSSTPCVKDLTGKIIPFRGRFAALPDKDLGQALITLEAVGAVEEMDPNIVADKLAYIGYQLTEVELPQRFDSLPPNLTGGFTASIDRRSAMAFRLINGQLVEDRTLLEGEPGLNLANIEDGIAIFKPTKRLLSMVGVTPLRYKKIA
jgi:hypothetical protein